MHGDRYHEAMAVYDWICIVDPPKGARTMQRVYELVAFISTTFQHRPEASQQLHTLLEKDPRSKRKKRVRDHQKWHSANHCVCVALRFGVTSLVQEPSLIICANVALWWINRLLREASTWWQKFKARASMCVWRCFPLLHLL